MAEAPLDVDGRINLDSPRYDQSTFVGRARHFFITTNPLNLFASGSDLDNAKAVVESYKKRAEPPGLTADEVWRAKSLYDSAFHPDTGEKMMLIGRMSAQVPMNMSITGCMMTWYRTTPAVLFWQWINQTFNAVVNYTNRSGDSPIPLKTLGISYTLATSGAVITALGVNKLVTKAPPIVGRFVPFTAVAAANCINIPCMRNSEMVNGIPVYNAEGERVGESTAAAKKAIGLVVFSRICMATPGMLIPPFIMQYLENKTTILKRFPWANAPIQVGLVGFMLVFATPLCCALFPQKSSMALNSLEADLQEKLKALPNTPDVVYFNKGL
ncbi:unnamed protein product [Owenia fusiformis]|uniref:Sidoreflexin n=1 Tax=Owenia fusiformis TaxID=6347 RepID=A0A8S4NQ46_OWEFU|nr:unnamed protein product [Owenia fusiformis]